MSVLIRFIVGNELKRPRHAKVPWPPPADENLLRHRDAFLTNVWLMPTGGKPTIPLTFRRGAAAVNTDLFHRNGGFIEPRERTPR